MRGQLCVDVIVGGPEDGDRMVGVGRCTSWLEHPRLSKGDSFDGQVITPEPPGVRILTKGAFFDRFTDAEIEAIMNASRTNARVAGFLKRLDLYDHIVLPNARLSAALAALEAAAILAPGRAAEILA